MHMDFLTTEIQLILFLPAVMSIKVKTLIRLAVLFTVGAGLYGPRNYATEQVSPTDARAVAQVVFGSPAVDLGFEIAAHSDIELDGVGGVAWDGALLC
jgi:hypothetical protein